jgi:hypothetical protein
MLMLALTATLASGCIDAPPVPDMRGAYTVSGTTPVTVPFRFDDNRMFVDIAFVAADGSLRKALAFVNQGSGSFVLSNKLYRDLGIGDGQPLQVRIGAMSVAVDPRAVQPEDMANSFSIRINPFGKPQTAAQAAQGPGGLMAAFSAPMNVEAVIPPALLARFDTVFDYGARTLTLAAPGTAKPQGIAVPIRVDPKSGFVTLDITVGGKMHPVVLDNGGSYSVVRSGLATSWIQAHPDWLRSEGTIGESNYVMAPGIDTNSPVLKIPGATLGGLTLEELGVSAPQTNGMLSRLVGGVFWNWYSAKAGQDVDGWIGGNVLKSFRVTLDTANRTSYWLQQAPLDTHDLDQAGLTLTRWKGVTGVAGIATKNGVATVDGAMPGDRILSIDGRPTEAMTRGELLLALHGRPGERKHLVLERKKEQVELDAAVTAF